MKTMKFIFLVLFFFLWTVHPRLIPEVKNHEHSIYDIPDNIFIGTDMEKKLHRATELAHIESFERFGMKPNKEK